MGLVMNESWWLGLVGWILCGISVVIGIKIISIGGRTTPLRGIRSSLFETHFVPPRSSLVVVSADSNGG